MGYKITPEQYEEAAKNAQADALEAEGKFLVALHAVNERDVNGEQKTLIEFKVLEGDYEGKVKTEWLRFENFPDEIKYDDQKRKQHYAAVNTMEKISVALGTPIQDAVADLEPQISQRLYITVKSAKSKDGAKTYYNTKEFEAAPMPETPKASKAQNDEAPF